MKSNKIINKKYKKLKTTAVDLSIYERVYTSIAVYDTTKAHITTYIHKRKNSRMIYTKEKKIMREKYSKSEGLNGLRAPFTVN